MRTPALDTCDADGARRLYEEKLKIKRELAIAMESIMIRIKCRNSCCTAPDGVFHWDERANVEGGSGLAKPGEKSAVSFIAVCPYCETENKIWLKRVKEEDAVTRRG